MEGEVGEVDDKKEVKGIHLSFRMLVGETKDGDEDTRW